MLEEKFMNDAFDSVVSCDEVKAMRVLKNAEKAGADLVELFMHGYSAGIEHMGDLFCKGEILLPKLLSSGSVLKTVAGEIEIRMALAEIKCAGVDYCLFSEKGAYHIKLRIKNRNTRRLKNEKKKDNCFLADPGVGTYLYGRMRQNQGIKRNRQRSENCE